MGKITYFYMWKAVKCSKADGRKFLALYQGDIGLHHLVWNGDHQLLIKPEMGDTMVDTSEEEADEIYGKIDKIVNGIYSNPIPSSKDKPSPQSTYKVTEVKVESPKPKVMSDFDLLTADVESI